MKLDFSELPFDYRQIPHSESGYEFSNRILSPVLKIEKRNGRTAARLGANVKKQGKKIFVPTLSLSHNWIYDNNIIKPLPYDSPLFILQALSESDPDDLKYPEILRLIKSGIEGVEVLVSPEITETANNRSLSLSLPSGVPGLRAQLYCYQEHGVAWLAEAIETIGGAILADEMGLGKTLQIIALFLLNRPSKSDPALIVCPTTLIANWKREIEKFAPSLTMQVHRGSERTGFYKDLMRSDIVITTYDTLVNDITIFRGVDWSFLVCDEAQAVKNPNSKRRRALHLIPRRWSIPVTGTPVENTLLDFWSLADLAVPGILDTQESFTVLYPDTEYAAQELNSVTDAIILKRRVVDVAGDLPERTDTDIPIELTTAEIQEYERIKSEAIAEYGAAGKLVAVGRLSMYCAHPWLRARNPLNTDWEEDAELFEDSYHPLLTRKMELCIQLLREALKNRKKVLVFVTYNHCGDLIRRAALDGKLPNAYWNSINGKTPQNNRQKIVDEFSNFEGPAVLVLNPKAAGSGLNITAATIVIHYTQNWNPALEMQASARAHRRGQEQPVTIYRLYYLGTVEETMVERSQWKRELGNAAIPISSRENEDLGKALLLSPNRGEKNEHNVRKNSH